LLLEQPQPGNGIGQKRDFADRGEVVPLDDQRAIPV
jgi:hypothetical protein